jgi:acyl-CoA thioesterase II
MSRRDGGPVPTLPVVTRVEDEATDDAVAELLSALAFEDDGDTLTSTTPSWFGDVLFGGFVIALAVAAASRRAPEGRRLHSLHAYFLRPVAGGAPIAFRPTPVREGRTFATLQLAGEQQDKCVVTATCSFTADADAGDAYVYDLGAGAALPPLDEAAAQPGPGPWIATFAGPTEPGADGTRASTHRSWFRIPSVLPDDVHLHTALLGFASDWTGIGGRPLHLEGDTGGMISLDHAVWFHRPARADEWLFFDVQSLVNFGGRGLLRGVMRAPDGTVVASVAQEMLLAVR